jgi:hypothetical protein
MRQRKGKYEPSDLSYIRQFGGSEIFMMLTNVKCRSIEAQIKDIILPAGEKPWGIDPTPVQDLPQEVSGRVTERMLGELEYIQNEANQMGVPVQITPEMVDARLMELTDEIKAELRKIADHEMDQAEQMIEDVLVEGEFYDQLADFIKDFATFPTAFMRGPFMSYEKALSWKRRPDGTSYPDWELKPKVRFKRVSPFDMYPAPAAKSLADGYNFERMRIRPATLMGFRKSPGFSPEAIDAVLLSHKGGYLANWLWTDQERANLENRHQEINDPTTMIEALLFYGDIPGKFLTEIGIKYEGSIADYVPVAVMMIDRWVVMTRINKHPLEWKPYYYASYDSTSESIWGNAPPELMEDCQRGANAAGRAIVNNMGVASGPQVEVDKMRVDPRDDISRVWPWKVWRTKTDPTGRGRFAIQFYQPNMMTNELLQVFNFFYGQAGEQLGIPAYEQGVASQAGGAGKTAHGLSMLMTFASKIMKEALSAIDRQVIKKVVFQTWLYCIVQGLMEYKGDINIIARASEYLIIAEQLQARRQEFLAFTNNPVDLGIIGINGRATVLRETTKSLKMDAEKIVPAEWELAARQGMAPAPLAPPGVPIPAGGGGAPPVASEAPVGGPGNKLLPPIERMANL